MPALPIFNFERAFEAQVLKVTDTLKSSNDVYEMDCAMNRECASSLIKPITHIVNISLTLFKLASPSTQSLQLMFSSAQYQIMD